MADILQPRPSAAMFPPGAFDRQDPSDDAEFYAEARLVTHIDDIAISALTGFYSLCLPPGGKVLDLMSSWVSHLPADAAYSEVTGLGMNADELAANPRLTRRVVQNLNTDPILPLEDSHFDAAVICVSVQYLQRPVEVLREVLRVLKPAAPVIISFSNRCFPTKAIQLWRMLPAHDHPNLVAFYLSEAGFSDIEAVRLIDGVASDPLTVVAGVKPAA